MNESRSTSALWWTLAGVGTALAVQALVNQRRKIDFTGKTIVITGGSRGLGLALTREFARQGANVAICARDAAELDAARQDLQTAGYDVFTHPCDITDKAQVQDFIEAVDKVLGPVDVLVNDAGIIVVSPLENTTEADFRDAMEINFWGAYNMVNAVLPQMRERRAGRIVNIASFGGKIAVPHLIPYSVSKFALVGYSEGLRAELLKDNIYVTTVCPGLIRTGSPRNAIYKGQNEKEYTAFKIGDSLPGITIAADACARQIVRATQIGKAEEIITFTAQLGTILQGLAPGLVADTMSLVNRALPAPGGIGERRAWGKDSETPLSQSILTTLTDQAAEANNELVK